MANLVNHYKEKQPTETIKAIQDFFTSHGYTLKYPILIENEAGTWSSRVELFDGTTILYGANGKGMTKEYCMASAHAELYERFCNKCGNVLNYSFMHKFIETSYKINGYYLHPEEKMLSYNEAIALPVINNFFTKLSANNDTIKKAIVDLVTDDIYIGEPFIGLTNKNAVVHIDPRLLYRATHSIGLSAGNTLEEALNQGISEIFEYEVNESFFRFQELEYHVIKKERLPINIKEKIDNIEAAGFKVMIFDLSYICGTPVVMSLLINPYQSNMHVNFGSFPVFDIAVERVITELYQGPYSYHDFNPMIQTPYRTETSLSEYLNNITSATFINEDIFNKIVYENEANKKVFIDADTNNEAILDYYINLAKSRGLSLYYKDNSLIDEVKAVSIIAPEILLRTHKLVEFENMSPLYARDIVTHYMHLRKQINEAIDFNKTNLDKIFERHQRIFNMVTSFDFNGSYAGDIECGNWYNPLGGFSNEQYTLCAWNQGIFNDDLPSSYLTNTIFYPRMKFLDTIRIYSSSELYEYSEIEKYFNLFDESFEREDIKQCNNDRYIFLVGWLIPFHNYYHSEDYERIIISHMK